MIQYREGFPLYGFYYTYKYCQSPRLCTPQFPNQYLCHYKMFENIQYLNNIYKNTAPQSNQRRLYSTNYKYFPSYQNLLNFKKEILEFERRKDIIERNNKGWIIGIDNKGRKYKYNNITGVSKWLVN